MKCEQCEKEIEENPYRANEKVWCAPGCFWESKEEQQHSEEMHFQRTRYYKAQDYQKFHE